MTEDQEFPALDLAGVRVMMHPGLREVPVSEFWASGTTLAGARGRGGAGLIELGPGVTGVFRDYRRGGALGWLLPRSYLDPDRPRRELKALARLRRAGVPVVEPLAALSRRHLVIFHRLRLITRYLVGARPLPEFLARESAWRRAAVREAGRVVALAFAAGLVHRDLHPDNLVARVVDGRGEVHLLDLDRALVRPPLTVADKDSMLLRMARYLRRHAGDLPVCPSAGESLRFLAGMGMSRDERRRNLDRWRPMYERQLARHGLAP